MAASNDVTAAADQGAADKSASSNVQKAGTTKNLNITVDFGCVKS